MPVLRLPWAETAGFSFVSDGEVRSFSADLARLIAEEAGFGLRLVRFDSPADVIAAMREGRGDILGGVGRLPALERANLFSSPVAETQFVLYVNSNAPNDWTIENFEGRRIGVIRSTAGSRMTPPPGATLVEFEDQITAFGKLLVGQIDGVVVVNGLGERTLRSAGIEGLIRPTFPPVFTNQHHVALGRDHADLMPAIEQAIARLESSGALDDLRARWFMVPAAPVPDVLTVGVSHFPPFQVVTDDGRFTGFSVELLRELAARSDIRLRFIEVTSESWAKGPRAGAFDLLPARSVNEDEKHWLQFSLPIRRTEYATFVTAGNADRPLDPANDRIGTVASSPILARISEELGTDLVRIPDSESAAAALLSGEIAALIYPDLAFATYIASLGREADFARIKDMVFANELAVAIRPGLGDIKRRLDVVNPGFLGSAEYLKLANTWFEPPNFWTDSRIRLLISASAAMAVLAVAFFFFQNWRARLNAERLRHETAAANERLSAVLANTRHAIFGFGADNEIAVINPSGQALLAPARNGTPTVWPETAEFLDPISEEKLDPDLDPLQRTLTGDMPNGQIYLFRPDPDHKARFVRVTSDKVTDPRTALKALLIVEDDHENELTRQKLDRSHRLSSMGMLTGGLAHDFNNILATMLYNAQLAKAMTDTSGARMLDRIIDAVGRGSDLTRRLLAFARRAPQPPSAVNLADSLRELEVLARPVIGETLRFAIPDIDKDLFVYCDSGDLENALLNLVLNARDAIRDSGRGDQVSIHVRSYDGDTAADDGTVPGPMLEISVSDNGPGMPPEVRRRATDPFFSTKTKAGGTGLGLAMVESFVARASGQLSIYSELGQGTTIRLRLPRVCANGGEIRQDRPGEILRGAGERVLLVEDQSGLREPMATLIQTLGYSVEPAETAADALALLEGGASFDLVLSDIAMPGGTSGLDLARAIRARFAGTAVILITGFADVGSDEVQALGVPVLQKPCPVRDLAAAVHAALRDHRARAPGRPDGDSQGAAPPAG